MEDIADEQFELLLSWVITQSLECAKKDKVACALLCFLTRNANTWRSIRTLQRNSPHKEVFAVDAGMMLRAMFDAYIQAEYIVADKTKSEDLARDYFDFDHVERYQRQCDILKHDNWLTRRLKSSPNAADGQKTARREYDRVKERFLRSSKKATAMKKDRVRDHWYAGNLAEIAKLLKKSDEYDILLSNFHGCVHSSSSAVQHGPPISSEHAITWASTIAARVARLSVDHNEIKLSDLYVRMLAELAKPYLGMRMA